jgi:7,8-dihydroneopterin aldolase/epimerase/oxygenase
MTDRIRVTRIAIFAHHGVLAEEAAIGQRFYISIEARVDTRRAGQTDDQADTVSYADLAAVAVEVGTTRRFNLIEALAEAVSSQILAGFPSVSSLVVRVEKPSAPVPAVIENVSVEIERARNE